MKTIGTDENAQGLSTRNEGMMPPLSRFEDASNEEHDRWLGFLAHPLDLNSASLEEIASLPWVDEEYARSIRERVSRSPLSDLSELCPEILPTEIAEKLRPFVTLKQPNGGRLSGRFSADERLSRQTNGEWTNAGCAWNFSADAGPCTLAFSLPRMSGEPDGETGATMLSSLKGYFSFRSDHFSIALGGFRPHPLHGLFYSGSESDTGESDFRAPVYRADSPFRTALSFPASGGFFGAAASLDTSLPNIGGYFAAPRWTCFASADSNLTGIRDAGFCVDWNLPLPMTTLSLFSATGPGTSTNTKPLLIAGGFDSSWFPGWTLGLDGAYASDFALFPTATFRNGVLRAQITGIYTGTNFLPPISAWNRNEGFTGARLDGSFSTPRFRVEGNAGCSFLPGFTKYRERYRLAAAWKILENESWANSLDLRGSALYRGSVGYRHFRGEFAARWCGFREAAEIELGAAGNASMDKDACGRMFSLAAVIRSGRIFRAEIRALRFDVPDGGDPFTVMTGADISGLYPESLSGSGNSLGMTVNLASGEIFRFVCSAFARFLDASAEANLGLSFSVELGF
jgi:hypothetical protein